MRRMLIVFVKEPRPGAVKTRLAADLGADDAAALYRAMAGEILRATAPAGEYIRVLFHAPASAGPALANWLPGETLVPQAEGDLGARMGAAFAWGFAQGADRIAIVGTDVPGLTRPAILAAFLALEAADVVLGPAADGGYWLIALRQVHPVLFTDMAWSTPSVLADTLSRADAAGLRVCRREIRVDIDTADDVRSEWSRLAPLLDAATGDRIAARVGRAR